MIIMNDKVFSIAFFFVFESQLQGQNSQHTQKKLKQGAIPRVDEIKKNSRLLLFPLRKDLHDLCRNFVMYNRNYVNIRNSFSIGS